MQLASELRLLLEGFFLELQRTADSSSFSKLVHARRQKKSS
jgi:hypothetical protein